MNCLEKKIFFFLLFFVVLFDHFVFLKIRSDVDGVEEN
jgi:hypothetical protein